MKNGIGSKLNEFFPFVEEMEFLLSGTRIPHPIELRIPYIDNLIFIDFFIVKILDIRSTFIVLKAKWHEQYKPLRPFEYMTT